MAADELRGLRTKDMLVLFAISTKGEPLTFATIARAFRRLKDARMRGWRVRLALKRLEARGFVRRQMNEGADPAYEVTDSGREAARDWAVAFEFASFEPDFVAGERERELKAPFPRWKNPWGL